MNIKQAVDRIADEVRRRNTGEVETRIWHNTFDGSEFMQGDICWYSHPTDDCQNVISISEENGKIECLELNDASSNESDGRAYAKILDELESGVTI